MPLRPFWGLLVLAAALPAQQYPFVAASHAPGNIEHILQDRQGRLWVSTHDDVLCFDGARFFSMHELGLPNVGNTNSLTEDDEGGILSSSGLGLYRIFDGRLENLLPGRLVLDAVAVAPGVLLASVQVGAGSAFFRLRRANGAWQAEELAGWRTGRALTRDHAGAILTPCDGGWCEWSAGAILDWRPGDRDRSVFHPSAGWLRVLRDRFGCVWFRTEESGAYQCPGDRRLVPLPAAVAGRNVWDSERENSDGSMLFANAGTLALGRPGAFQIASPASGLPAEAITCAVEARDGTIWAGSIGGLYRFPYPFRLTYWKSRFGLVWGFVRTGGAIISGTGAGIARLTASGEWKILPGSREFGSVGSLLAAPDGSLYGAISREAVVRFAPGGELVARTPPGRGGDAGVLARGADGSIWLAGSGIYRVSQRGRELILLCYKILRLNDLAG